MTKSPLLILCICSIGGLSACGGGGGGGGDSGGSGYPVSSIAPRYGAPEATLSDPGLSAAASAWVSDEYRHSTGLSRIRAAQGYAARTLGLPGGQGTRVAVIDSGIDFSNPEFANAESYRFANSNLTTDTRDRAGHGTHVAGIIAARRDGYGVHGIAYNAQPVALKVLEWDGAASTSSNTGDSDIARAILSAAGISTNVPIYNYYGTRVDTLATITAAHSDVINMSLGGPGSSSQIRNAMRDAAQAGTIIVSSLGNEGIVGPTGAPAVYSDQLSGMGIAVAALNEAGSGLASFSNSCGSLVSCISAPGEFIQSTVPNYSNGFGDIGYAYASGTSMAAPYVSGAAALAIAAFPGVSPEDIVDRIFETATDLGASGWDSTYGYGRLNVGALMQPIGGLSVTTGSTVSGQSVDVTRFQSVAGPGGSGAALAAGARTVMAVDERGFPFAYDLSDTGASGQRATQEALDDFIAFDTAGHSSAILPDLGLAVSFVHEDQPTAGHARSLREEDVYGTGQANVSFAVAPGLILGLSSQSGLTSDLSGTHMSLVSSGLLGSSATDADPVPFSGEGDAVRMAYALTDNLWVETGVHMAEGYYGDSDTNTALFGLRHRLGAFEVGARVAYVEEDGAILGTVYDGYTNSLSAETVTGGVDLAWQATNRTSFSAGYSVAQTQSHSSGLAEFGTQISDSFSAAAQIRALFGEEDRLTLIASLPFATQSAMARMRLPVGRTQSGAVLYETQQVDISTDRRERALQAIYSVPISNGAQLDLAAYARANADHIRGREDAGAAIRFFKRF